MFISKKIIKKLKNKVLNKPQPTYLLSGDEGVDDEYYINEVIGIPEITYDWWIGKEKNEKH